MRFLCKISALLILCAISAQSVDIVNNGQAKTSIITGEKASKAEHFAASELKRIVKKTSGAELTSNLPNQIVIGTPKTNPEIAKVAGFLGLDGKDNDYFVIKTKGNKIYVGANTGRGALFGTMELMEKLGARWFWPGPDGEYVLKSKNLKLDNISIESRPVFESRQFLGHYREPGFLWCARNKLRNRTENKEYIEKYGQEASWGGHSYNWIFPEGCKTIKEYFAKYPEQFAMTSNGVRITKQHCFTNPDTFDTFYKWIIKFWETHPEIKNLNLSPRDTPNYCRCEKCAKHSPSYNKHKFTADLIRKVNKKYPDKTYSVIAYSFYRPVVNVKYPANTWMAYCMYERCYKHKFGDETCKANQRAKKGIGDWIATGNRMGYYGYEYDATNENMFFPLAPLQIDTVRYLRKIGVKHFKTERFAKLGCTTKIKDLTKDPWFANRFSGWITAKALWNPQVKHDELLKDYCKYVYGKAANDMVNYYLTMQKGWQGKGHVSYYFASPESIVDNILPPEIAQNALQYLNKAEAKLKDAKSVDEKRAQKMVELDKAIFMRWKNILDKRNNWNAVKDGKGGDRAEFLKNAAPGKVLYEIDLKNLKVGDHIKYLEKSCTVAEENGMKYVKMVPPPSLAFGNHPYIFRSLKAGKWINYEASFNFRFPAKTGRNMVFWVQVRNGGERFGKDNYRCINLEISPSRVQAVMDTRNKIRFSPIGMKRWRDLSMKNLERDKWYKLRIRVVDLKLYVHIERDGKSYELLNCPVKLGGGAINIRAYKNFIGELDFTELKICEIPSPSLAQMWTVNVPYVNATPRMDGDLKSDCWKKAWHGIMKNRNPGNRKLETEVSVLRNDKALYIKAKCYFDNKFPVKANQLKRDDDQWKDDCIELCLDPDNTRTDYYYLIANSIGKQYDAMASIGLKINKKWDTQWRVANYKGKDYWTVIFELPFASFGTPTAESNWLMGINRSGHNIRQSWTDGSYHNPNSFKSLKFK
jgi:hypothetical protein